jgi:uncharacterized protein DUF4386
MVPTTRDARIAGWLYILMGLPAPFALIYVPDKLIVRGNAVATAANILAHQTLFRLGMLAELTSLVLFIVLVMALYHLLSGVSKGLARVMVAFVLTSVAVGFLNVLNDLAALTLFRGGDFLGVFDKHQLDALGMLFLGLYRQGLALDEIFWGLWLLPFGLLVMRSRFLPRLLGILLIVNCFAYVAVSLTTLFVPEYAVVLFRAAQPALLGEAWIMLWLVIKGVKPQPLAAAA